MSVVSNVIFSFSISEKENGFFYSNMEKINKWLQERNYGVFSVDVDVISGGRKHLEAPLFVAAFNYFVLEDFCNFVRSLKWEYPDFVQIIIQEQEDGKFRLIEPCRVIGNHLNDRCP